MKHLLPVETRSALPIETRDDNPPSDIADAIAAVTELRTAATAFETRIAEQLAAVTTRLDDDEARSQRIGATGDAAGNTQAAAEIRAAFATYLRHGPGAPADQVRTLTVSSETQGGYLAPAEMSTEFQRDLVQVSPVRQIASVRTTGAPSVQYPKRTGITNAKWKGEGQAQEGSEPSFGQAEIVIREVNTFVDLSNQLLADAAASEAEVRLALADDFGGKEASAFVKGNGSIEPEGYMTNGDIAYTANGHATNLSADALITLMYAVPAMYRNAGTWAMNGTTLAAIRKLKDGQGNYLWNPSYQASQPETILGRPVVEMIDMDDVAANAFPIAFGDFSGYRIVDRLDLSILVNPYLLATQGLTRIHATRRVGGGVLQAAKFRKLKMSTN